MAVKKLSAPVGATKRITEGKTVKNNAADVTLVQQMLIDNSVSGITLTGKCDSKLVKAIQAFQKSSLKYKTPDGIVDPGLPTEKKLTPKYAAAQKKRDAQKYMRITMNSKCYIVTEAEYKKLYGEAVKKLVAPICNMRKQFSSCKEIYEHYLSIGQWEKGTLSITSYMVVVSYSGVNLPKASYYTKAESELIKAERAMSGAKLEDMVKNIPPAQAAINKFSDEISKFLKANGNASQTIGTALAITTAVGWVAIGAMAGPVLVTGAGLTAAEAAIVAGGTTSAMQSLAKEIGKLNMQDKSASATDIIKSAFNVSVDAVTGAVTGGIGNKLQPKFIDSLVSTYTPMLAKQVGKNLTSESTRLFLKTYLSGAGYSFVQSSATKAVQTVMNSAKLGRLPTEKELTAATVSIVFSSGLGAIFKTQEAFAKNWAGKDGEAVCKKIGENAIARLGNKAEVDDETRAKLFQDITKGTINTVVQKLGVSKAISMAKGTESVDQLAASAEKIVLSDKAIQQQTDAMLAKLVKAQGR